MTRGDIVIVPEDAPKSGEIYKHYKGDLYEVVFLAEHNDPDELCVIYKAYYKNPDFPYFSRLLKSWQEDVEWNGEKVKRFTKVMV
jgi:hypothetical protein